MIKNDTIHELLQQRVVDEGKIVTYKTLSRELGIHVNVAKKSLKDFYEQYSAKYNLGASFVVIAATKDEFVKGFKVMVVSENDLNAVESKFSSVSSSHIYGIYKGNIVDKNALFNVDYGQLSNSQYSAIQNSAIEIKAAKIVKSKPNQQTSTGPQATAKSQVNEPAKSEAPKSTANKSKNPDIFNLFKKQEGNKNVAVKSNDKVSPTKSKTENKSSVKALFSKQAEKASSKPKESLDKDKEPVSCELPKPKEDPVPKVKDSGKKKTVSKTKVSKHQRDDEDFDSRKFQPVNKKHKRLLVIQDSESESENEENLDKAQRDFFESQPKNNEEKEDVMDIEEDDQPIPPTPPVSNLKRKKMKTVTKTFQDEDGFFVTKKIKEYVSASEDSDVEETKKTVDETPRKTASISPAKNKKPTTKTNKSKSDNVKANVNKKQASLTSFFKQK